MDFQLIPITLKNSNQYHCSTIAWTNNYFHLVSFIISKIRDIFVGREILTKFLANLKFLIGTKSCVAWTTLPNGVVVSTKKDLTTLFFFFLSTKCHFLTPLGQVLAWRGGGGWRGESGPESLVHARTTLCLSNSRKIPTGSIFPATASYCFLLCCLFLIDLWGLFTH